MVQCIIGTDAISSFQKKQNCLYLKEEKKGVKLSNIICRSSQARAIPYIHSRA